MNANARIKKSAAMVRALLEESQIPRNQVAAAGGLTNTYIRDLEQGKIANVSREKLIHFGVALNLNLNRIDELLKVFDRAALARDDIPVFIETAANRKSSAALHPVRDFYAYELVVHSMERAPGDQVMVNDRPTVCLRPAGHRTYTDMRLVEAHPIYADLVEEIGRARYETLERNLTEYKVEHFICKDCLEDYLFKSGDEVEKKWRQGHVRNLLLSLKRYPNLVLNLTGVCSNMLFTIKKPRNGGVQNINFCAKPGHYVPGERPGRLAGFFTSNPVILQTFKDELDSIKTHVLDEFQDPDRLFSYLEKLLEN